MVSSSPLTLIPEPISLYLDSYYQSTIDRICQLILELYTEKTEDDWAYTSKEGISYKLKYIFIKIIQIENNLLFECIFQTLNPVLGIDCEYNGNLFIKESIKEEAFRIILFLMKNELVLSQDQKDDILIDASWRGKFDCVKKLIESGANPNAFSEIREDLDGSPVRGRGRGASIFHEGECIITIRSALSGAVYHGSNVLVEYLLDSGANINAHDDLALTTVSKTCNEPILKLLINRGADVANSKAPLIRNAIKGTRIIALLLENGANTSYLKNRDIKKLIKRGDYNLVKRLVESGLSLEAFKPSYSNDHVRNIASYLVEMGVEVEDICELFS